MMNLYVNNLQIGRARNMTDLVGQIVDKKVLYVERREDGYNVVTADRYGRNTRSLMKESMDKRRGENIGRILCCRYRRRPQRFKVLIDGEYSSTCPTIHDFLMSLFDVDVLFVDVVGTVVYVTTGRKYGSRKRTAELCSESLNYHLTKLRKRLERYLPRK